MKAVFMRLFGVAVYGQNCPCRYKIEWVIQARSAFSEKTLQRALLLLWEKSAGATLGLRLSSAVHFESFVEER
ncbi:MAG: hypothetical protein PUE99_10635 [Anaerovibrio sp.]|nr:hypothetical protein [Anaerovibrio sp.]